MAYNSVYFKKLDEVKASASKAFDAEKYARDYFDKKLVKALDSVLDINILRIMLLADQGKTFNRYSHALGIGNLRYFLVKGVGEITDISENTVTVVSKTDNDLHRSYNIATEFVYGNEIRDASGLINLNEFPHTADFNNVSAEIDKIVRSEVLPPFKSNAKKGEIVQFVGAIELNSQHLNVDNIEIIPISLKIISNK